MDPPPFFTSIRSSILGQFGRKFSIGRQPPIVDVSPQIRTRKIPRALVLER